MPEELYSENESLDRIYRILRGDGDTLNEAPNTLTPPLHPTNESLSRIAELLAGTLEGESLKLNRYGSIFTATGASYNAQTLVSGTATKINQFLGVDTDAVNGVTPDHTNDRIRIDGSGVFDIGYSLNFYGSTGTTYAFLLYQSTGGVGYILNDPIRYASGLQTGTLYSISASGLNDLNSGDLVWLSVQANQQGAHFYMPVGNLYVKSV